MDGPMTPQLICRACLKIVENKNQSFGFVEDAHGNLKDMIMCCIPEMDIYVSSNPILCFPCIQLLVTVYNFKTRCLNTETIIRSYIQRNNLTEYNHVNLNCVIHELIKLNSQYREVQLKTIEAEKQRVEGNLYHPNGVPYGAPQGVPESHPDFQPVLMDHENTSRNHVMGANEDVMGGTEMVLENRFLPSERDIAEQEGMLQNLLTHPDDTENPPNQVLMDDGVYQSTEEYQNKDILEPPTMENQSVTENQAAMDSTCDKLENNSHETNHKSEETREKDGDSTKSRERTEDTKTATTQENNNNSSVSIDELQKDTPFEKRPRLIIKICKNKITLPFDKKREDSNEKENKEMDVDKNRKEIPPPASAPFDAREPQHRNDQELYECPGCTFITTHLDYYNAHKTNCYGNNFGEKKCPHCPHVTNRQNALDKHINTMHTRSTWYTCDRCNYRSTDSSCLRRHKRNIHPEKTKAELTCRQCNYRCTTNYHLEKHMRKHDANSVLNCEFCAYSTRDRSNFRKHIFIHNPKAQDCEFCDYKCVSPYQMKHHLKKMHHGVGMEDVDCRSEVSISKVVQDISAAIKEAKECVERQTE